MKNRQARKPLAQLREEALARGRKEHGYTGARVESKRTRRGLGVSKTRCVRTHRRKRYGGSGSGRYQGAGGSTDEKVFGGLLRLALTCKTTAKRLYFRGKLHAYTGKQLEALNRLTQIESGKRAAEKTREKERQQPGRNGGRKAGAGRRVQAS